MAEFATELQNLERQLETGAAIPINNKRGSGRGGGSSRRGILATGAGTSQTFSGMCMFGRFFNI